MNYSDKNVINHINKRMVDEEKLKVGYLYYLEYFKNNDDANLMFDIGVYVGNYKTESDCFAYDFEIYRNSPFTIRRSFGDFYRLFNVIHFDKQPSDFLNISIDPNLKS